MSSSLPESPPLALPCLTHQQAQLIEQQMLQRTLSSGQTQWQMWRQQQAIIVTRKDAHLTHFEQACRALNAEGWPVFVRSSGGTAVPAGAGILNLSLTLPARSGLGPDDYYQLLGAPLLACLKQLGIEAGYGPVPGSFCDGRYNLVAAGRKITGTAQHWRAAGSEQGGAVLAHAMVMVAGDMELGTRLASRFYEIAGGALRFAPNTSTTIGSLLGWQGSDDEQALRFAALLQPCLVSQQVTD